MSAPKWTPGPWVVKSGLAGDSRAADWISVEGRERGPMRAALKKAGVL